MAGILSVRMGPSQLHLLEGTASRQQGNRNTQWWIIQVNMSSNYDASFEKDLPHSFSHFPSEPRATPHADHAGMQIAKQPPAAQSFVQTLGRTQMACMTRSGALDHDC